MPFVENWGLYQGDIWYFFYYYGDKIQHLPFYSIEYPIGYVYIHKLTYTLNQLIFREFTYHDWVISNALIMTPLILSSVYLMMKISYLLSKNPFWTYLFIALSPSFFIASTTNYDIYPTFLTLLAIYLLLLNRYLSAFIFLAIGAVIKLYPGFLIPLFLLFVYSKEKSLKKTIKYGLVLILIVVGSNLPFALSDFSSWIFPYTWQPNNPQRMDPNTISFYFSQVGLDKFRTPFFGVVILISWVAAFLFYKYKKLTTKNLILLSFFTTISAVFGNHVNCPQYIMWFLPFVSILQTPYLFLWWIFDLTNASVLFSYFKLHNDYPHLLKFVFHFNTFYLLSLYLYLIYHLYKSLYEKDN